MKLKVILLLLLFFKLSLAQNVIIIVVDGARYSETFGAGSTYIPHMNNDMKPFGVVYTNFRIAHEGITSTNPGHSSILTGTWQLIANDGTQRPTKPTVFEYFRKELGSSVTQNYVVTGKEKLDVISYSTDPNYGILYQASENCFDITDGDVYSNLISIMDTYHPRLIIVNLPDTDRRAHANDWDGYLSAITNADNIVYQLWQKIQTDPFYQNNTTLFVTNDHGRHDDAHGGFQNHGDDCDGCEHIMLLAIGRNVSQGIVNSDLHYQIDLGPTIGDLLGFDTPQAIGISLFQGSNPLPVEISFFTATVLENEVKLNWRTQTEISNYGFEIERLQKFHIEKLQEWEDIGFVQGYGNSNSPKYYSFVDENVSSGKYSYRLKQIDTDGKFEYSKVVEVNLNSTEKFELSQNYPNPFNPVTMIKYHVLEISFVTLKIYDVLGKAVETLVSSEKAAGDYQSIWNAESVPSGVYFYTLQAGSFTETKKMVVMK